MDENIQTQEYLNHKKTNIFQRFFWFCSGVDITLLTGKNPEFETPLKPEYSKYVGTGAAVFFTAIFATISATFAISFMFESPFESQNGTFKNEAILCLVCGVFWGINIFFLDRYLVSTMRKEEGSLMKGFTQALPRIAIGLIFACTISVPIELTLFRGRVQVELTKMNNANITACGNACDEMIKPLQNRINVYNAQITNEQQKVAKFLTPLMIQESQLSTTINNFQKIINENLNNNIPSSGEVGLRNIDRKALSNVRKEIDNYNTNLNKFINSTNELITPIQAQIIHIQTVDCPSIIASCKVDAKKNNDLLSRYEALGKLKETFFSPIWWASTMIQLLFVFLELAPIISKLITKRGSYDVRIDYLEQKEETAAKMILEEIDNKNKRRREQLNRDLRKAELDAEAKIAEAKTKLYDVEKQQETEKIRLDNEAFLAQQINADAHDKSWREQKLKNIIENGELFKNLEETEAKYKFSIDTIKEAQSSAVELQRKTANYIKEKQFEFLKRKIDAFFSNQQEKTATNEKVHGNGHIVN